MTPYLPARAESALKRVYIGMAVGARRLIYALRPRDFDHRWRATEEPRFLTWGTMLEGRSFFEEAQKATDVLSARRVLEIGPGYGRLLQARRELGAGPDLYVGVDLSKSRVEDLTKRLGDDRSRFIEGDARTVDLAQTAPFDLLISSGTFEHLYPDFVGALRHLKSYLAAEAKVVFDLPDTGHPWNDINTDPTGVFMRVYTAKEIAAKITKVGFRLICTSQFEMASRETIPDGGALQRTAAVSLQNGRVALVHRIMTVACSS